MRHPLPKRRLIFSSDLTAVVMKKGLKIRHRLPKRRLTFSSVLTAVVMKKGLKIRHRLPKRRLTFSCSHSGGYEERAENEASSSETSIDF
jgi:hypothetical protein